ncbi:MAG TPA: transposase [Kiritimatiellia bacterium]|nr:transposase [Kiritimatiellia bacterium]
MARQLRHHFAGGWYHITTRGMGRREIFSDDRDREHFVELLAGMVERYGVILHAYVLMENHYHLLIETPAGNASRALQWLNVSYAAWFNAKHGRCGPLFQARFKSIPVENEGSWALACSVYIHLNPVRIKPLGLGKEDRAREKSGFLPAEPTREEVRARLAKLRGHRWSSYPAYAGYTVKPEWLTCEAVWRRGGADGKDLKAEYRRYLEEYLRQGVAEGAFARLTAAVAIGGTAFVEGLRKKIPKRMGEGTNARAWRRLLPFAEVVRAVEAVKGEPWAAFADRKGDWGRDLALYVGRMRCGLTLNELGRHAGGMGIQAVSKACGRMGERLKTDKGLQRTLARVRRALESGVKA